MVDEECPIDAVERALSLASQLEVGDIPVDFDPGDMLWREIIATITGQFSNHATLREQLLDDLNQARMELDEACPFVVEYTGDDHQEDCGRCYVATYRLREAALAASEKAYQRWLARAALRRAAERDA